MISALLWWNSVAVVKPIGTSLAASVWHRRKEWHFKMSIWFMQKCLKTKIEHQKKLLCFSLEFCQPWPHWCLWCWAAPFWVRRPPPQWCGNPHPPASWCRWRWLHIAAVEWEAGLKDFLQRIAVNITMFHIHIVQRVELVGAVGFIMNDRNSTCFSPSTISYPVTLPQETDIGEMRCTVVSFRQTWPRHVPPVCTEAVARSSLPPLPPPPPWTHSS